MASWNNNPNYNGTGKIYNRNDIVCMLKWLINNTFFHFGNKIFRQTIGIPMGTNAASFIANLYLFKYEYDFVMKLSRNNYADACNLRYMSRYIDDLTSLNDNSYFMTNYKTIYPASLELKHVNQNNKQADVLDIAVNINGKKAITTVYDKRDNFPFTSIGFSHITPAIYQIKLLKISFFHK